MIRIWLDDERPMPIGYDVQFRSALRCWEYIQDMKARTELHISFDHDLGHDIYDGYWLAKEIEKQAYGNEIQRVEWRVHSQNPVGRRNINLAMSGAAKAWKAVEEALNNVS